MPFTRRHERYLANILPVLPPHLGGRMRVDVLSAETRATLDARSRWVSHLSGGEHLRVWMGNKLLSDVSSQVELERLDGARGAPGALARLDVSRFAWGEAPASARRSDLPAPPDAALAALTLEGALTDFAKKLEGGHNSVHDATDRLASYLSVHPEAIAELVARLRGGTLPEQLHAVLFLALEKTGTLAAESGLASALTDRGLSTQDRMRAAAALQDIPKPSERTAKTLIDQARGNRADGEERQVADAWDGGPLGGARCHRQLRRRGLRRHAALLHEGHRAAGAGACRPGVPPHGVHHAGAGARRLARPGAGRAGAPLHRGDTGRAGA
jgi:hypothetical protein